MKAVFYYDEATPRFDLAKQLIRKMLAFVGNANQEPRLIMYQNVPNITVLPRRGEHPVVTFRAEGSILTKNDLKFLEGKLNEGYTVFITKAGETPADQPAQPNTTCTETSLNPSESVMQEPDWEKEYWKLRTCLRNGILRARKYKLTDTAEIAEKLLRTGDREQATRSFAEIIDQATRHADRRPIFVPLPRLHPTMDGVMLLTAIGAGRTQPPGEFRYRPDHSLPLV